MGIHSGPVNEITDLNEQANIAGAGINVAERVMDCGDAGRILLSQHVAEDLEQYPRWRLYLHNLGKFEVKHGVRVNVANLYSNEVGNPQLCQANSRQLRNTALTCAGRRWRLVCSCWERWLAETSFFLHRPVGSKPVIVDKSIAVLPFENRSRDPDNAYFTDGIQDGLFDAPIQDC